MTPFHLSIQFKKSKSADFDYIIELCDEFDHFTKGDRYSLDIYSVMEIFNKWEAFIRIHYKVRSWKGVQIILNEKPLLYSNMDQILTKIKECYFDKFTSLQDQKGYCDDSDWGCRCLQSVKRFVDNSEYKSNVYWFKFGRFTDDQTWKIDKKKLVEILSDEAKRKMLHQCPVFNEYKITSILLRLPDSIYVDGVKWIKLYKTEETKKGTVKIAHCIEMTSLEPSDYIPEFLNEYPSPSALDIDNMTEEEINNLIESKRHK